MNICPYCNSTRIVKNGIKYSKQRYICKDCKKSFCLVDGRIRRDIREKELCLLLYSHNLSLRSIQDTSEKIFNTKISFSLIQKWIKSFNDIANIGSDKVRKNLENKKSNRTKKIEVVNINEFKNYVDKLSEKCEKIAKYYLILTENEIKLLQIKSTVLDEKSNQ